MIEDVLKKLNQSKFRSSFKLGTKYKDYIHDKGLATIETHAKDFISRRIAPAILSNDGKQTPYRGHPVFIAQHATATCCRGCIQKWHGFSKGRDLTESEKDYLVKLIMAWIRSKL